VPLYFHDNVVVVFLVIFCLQNKHELYLSPNLKSVTTLPCEILEHIRLHFCYLARLDAFHVFSMTAMVSVGVL